jgi:hypothetical protein
MHAYDYLVVPAFSSTKSLCSVRLAVRQQLIRSVDGPTRSSSPWGISLPSTFVPHSMSISALDGKAVLLITGICRYHARLSAPAYHKGW